MENQYHIIVIGLGGIGSAALYYLSKHHKSTLGIDQFQVPHVLGSTHGGSRITRLANGEGEFHTRLAMRAATLWRAAENATQRDLLHQCGGILVSHQRAGSAKSTFNNTENYFERTVQLAAQFNIPHEIWNAQEAHQKYPQFHFAAGEDIYYEPSAGYLRPEAAIETHLQLAQHNGAELRQQAAVLNIDETPHGVRVETSQGVFIAGQVVIAAGPWIGKVLLPYHHLFRIIRQIVFWFDVADWRQFQPEVFPVYISPSRSGEKGTYGFPAIDGKNGGIKIASEYLAQAVDIDEVDRTVHEEEIAEIYQHDIQPYLRNVMARCLHASTCLFTETPDHGFLIDRHPQMNSVIVASPCSGYGFKFAPALGELIAQIIAGENNADIKKFSFDRLLS